MGTDTEKKQLENTAPWLNFGFGNFEGFRELFEPLYILQWSPKVEDAPDFFKAWEQAFSGFINSFGGCLEILGFVPKEEHQKTSEKYLELKDIVEKHKKELSSMKATVTKLKKQLADQKKANATQKKDHQNLVKANDIQQKEIAEHKKTIATQKKMIASQKKEIVDGLAAIRQLQGRKVASSRE